MGKGKGRGRDSCRDCGRPMHNANGDGRRLCASCARVAVASNEAGLTDSELNLVRALQIGAISHAAQRVGGMEGVVLGTAATAAVLAEPVEAPAKVGPEPVAAWEPSASAGGIPHWHIIGIDTDTHGSPRSTIFHGAWQSKEAAEYHMMYHGALVYQDCLPYECKLAHCSWNYGVEPEGGE